MHPKWIISLAMLFLGGTILSGLLEQQYLGTSSAGMFHDLMNGYKELNFSNPFVAITSVISVAWDYVQMLWNLFWWNYSFFYGTWEVVRYFCWCISIGIIASLIMSVTRGTSSA